MNRRRRELRRRAATIRDTELEAAAAHTEPFIASPRPALSYTALAVVLFPVFIFAGIAAPILIGQTIARALTSLGLSSYFTIWLVPGSSILVVYFFWKAYKRLGIPT